MKNLIKANNHSNQFKNSKRGLIQAIVLASVFATGLICVPNFAAGNDAATIESTLTDRHLSDLKKRKVPKQTFVVIQHRIEEESDVDAIGERIVPQLYQSVMQAQVFPVGPLNVINAKTDPGDESVVLMSIAVPIAVNQADAARAVGLKVVERPAFEAMSVMLYGSLANTEQATKKFYERAEAAGHNIEPVVHFVYEKIVGPESDENVTVIMAALLPARASKEQGK